MAGANTLNQPFFLKQIISLSENFLAMSCEMGVPVTPMRCPSDVSRSVADFQPHSQPYPAFTPWSNPGPNTLPPGDGCSLHPEIEPFSTRSGKEPGKASHLGILKAVRHHDNSVGSGRGQRPKRREYRLPKSSAMHQVLQS